MAVDFQIVFPQETVRLTSVSRVPGSSPAAFDIMGEDFTSVDEVLINDFRSPSYFVVSPVRLIATVPPQVPAAAVSSVRITSRRLTLTSKSVLRFQVSRIPSKVTGILRLVQLFTKVLFTRPGSDIFSKQLGGNGLAPLGRNLGKDQTGNVLSDFVIAVDNTSRQLVAIQGRQPQLPPDERLLSARVTSAQFSLKEAALVTTVELTSQAGRSALANVVM